MGEVDLSSHLDAARTFVGAARTLRVRGPQLQRNRTNRPDVRRDLFPTDSIAARRAAHERPVLVGEREAQAVDLQFRDVIHLLHRLPGRGETPPHARIELTQLLFGVRVVETEHRLGVLDGLEAGGRAAADALGRRIGRDEIGVLGFEALELLHERVEFGVGQLGIVEDVVPLFVVANFAP